MQFLLARHGAVDVADLSSFYGCLDVPLSPLGRQQAQNAAIVLADRGPDKVVSSPLSRATYEADLVGDYAGLEVEILPGLMEIDRGAWAGLPLEEVQARWPGQWEASLQDPEGWDEHGGESFAALRARVVGCIQGLTKFPTNMNLVVVVAHLWPIALLLELAGAGDRPTFNEKRIPKGSISSIRSREGIWTTEWIGRMPENLPAALDS